METGESGTGRLFGCSVDSQADTWELETQLEMDSMACSESRSGVDSNGGAPRFDLQWIPHLNLRKMFACRNHGEGGKTGGSEIIRRRDSVHVQGRGTGSDFRKVNGILSAAQRSFSRVPGKSSP